MKNLLPAHNIAVLLLCGLFACSPKTKQPVDYVDPFICTQGDHGHWHPAALVPFGMVKLGPDTYPGSLTADGDLAHGGYDYSDHQLRGFSHVHRGSSGGGQIKDRAGLISFVPFTNAAADTFYINPVLEFDKNTEEAEAGYYKVHLTKDNIWVELTATERSGMQKYSPPGDIPLSLFINSGNRGNTFTCKQTSSTSLEGSVSNYFFVAEFNTPISETNIWNSKSIENSSEIENQRFGGMVCRFDEIEDGNLLVKVGLSLTGIEAARENLEAECGEWHFESTRGKASKAWNDKLSVITVKGNSEDDKTIFYTALYHTCFLPHITSNVDGTYPGLDKKIHTADGYRMLNNYAFWDSFRTKYPLYSIWIPDVYQEVAQSLRDIYNQAGNWDPFPDNDHPPHGFCYTVRGEEHYNPCTTCRHEHMLMVMGDAYFKGLFNFPLESVYSQMKHEAMIQMPERYDSIGFIPARPDQTGEYSWDNLMMANLAKELGKEDEYNYFLKRSKYWENTWDSSIKFFRARAADGTWLDFPEDPTVNREKYTYEGSKWHWRWNALHDVPTMIEKFGGKQNFIDKLDYFFENDLYTAGNQIDIHAPFLFNEAGAPWLTQKWVRKILTEPIVQKYGTHNFFPEPIFDRVYKTTPDGYLEEMDCDYGCMAAWYNMAAMGIYQVCPGQPVYQITAPIFDEVKIKLDNKFYKGKEFVIKAQNLSDKNIYVQAATLNGELLERAWLNHNEITNGGELVFEMGPKPNKSWGVN